MKSSTETEINFEYYRLFAYAWHRVHQYYNMDQSKNDHLFLDMFKEITERVDPYKGTPSSYIFRGVRMRLRGRFITLSKTAVRKYAYNSEMSASYTESVETKYLRDELVAKLVKLTKLTVRERELLNEMFFTSMGSAEEARRNLGTPYSKSRGGQIYCSMMQKLRAKMEELNANT